MQTEAPLKIGLLTGADDPSYAIGLTSSLTARGVAVDFIGSDQVDGPQLHGTPLVNFLNLRGDQSTGAALLTKVQRLLAYYLRLMGYAARAEPRVFHILWNNKFEFFDRTLLMLYYRALGRRVVLTAHNVNRARRDGHDSWLNRASLRVQYRLASHLFVHTGKMADELVAEYGVSPGGVSVIPFGIESTLPTTKLDGAEARRRLGIAPDCRVMLGFGQIAPYKGLAYLAAALPGLMKDDPRLHLVIAGKLKQGFESDWRPIESVLSDASLRGRVTLCIRHIPDSEVEVFMKAADVLVMPYVDIFQSGVLFCAYSFGLPVIASDVGSLKDDIDEGRTGLVCRPRDPADLARAVRQYFDSELYRRLDRARAEIRAHVEQRHAWSIVAGITESVYRRVLVDG